MAEETEKFHRVVYDNGVFVRITENKAVMDAANIQGVPAYYQFFALTKSIEDFTAHMNTVQGLVDSMDLTGPFALLGQVMADEGFAENRMNLVKFLQEDFPAAAQVAEPYVMMLTEHCQTLNESLDSLFLNFVQIGGEALVFLQELIPAMVTLATEQWNILLAMTHEIWLLIQDTIIGVLQMLLLNFAGFYSLGSSYWQKFWTMAEEVSLNTVRKIVDHVKNLVNSVIDSINSLLKFVGSVGGKLGLNLDWEIPKFANGGFVGKTGLALVHEGEFVLSKAMLNGQQATPSSIVNRQNQPAITINAQVIDKETLTEMLARLNNLMNAPTF